MSEAISTEPVSAVSACTAVPQTVTESSVEVFAVYGVEPEIQAYAMAKYSRSSLSMKESLKEITLQKAEKFLNTFYFQYGHRSIADLAHIALAIEKLSILAAIVVADEQRWDGQERSTRYQDFRKSGYYTPKFESNESKRMPLGASSELSSDHARALYKQTIEALFTSYEKVSQSTFAYLSSITPRPAEMKFDAYERTLRARAFDVSRYLLPLATNTSLGEIVNARTLETQIAHLLAQPHREVRHLGERLKHAAVAAAYNANEESLQALVADIRTLSPELADRAERELLHEVRVAPTLVKYADPNQYEIRNRKELSQAAAELTRGATIEDAPLVDLVEEGPRGGSESESFEMELATSLVYAHCHYSYRQLRKMVEDAGEARRREIIDLGLRHRGKHDELPRPFSAGQQFRFDILMDIGGFRDMHRHRRCIQIMQDFTTLHGFDAPPEMDAAGIRGEFDMAMQRTAEAVQKLSASGGEEAAQNSQYAIPLAFRKRTLFKMDFAEAVYISELRTTPAGHASYRNVAYAMYEAVAAKYPALAKYFRVIDVREPVDILKR